MIERAALPAPLAPWRTLAGRYRLERLLGSGGMASVWLAEDGVLERKVAVKVIADTLACEEGWLRRFRREALAIAALNHPNVVRVFDLGEDGGRPFIVMQYVPGGNLARLLRAGRAPRGPLDSRRIATGLLRGVEHIHAAGLLHRDIKPGNILVGEDGTVMVSDFGVVLAPDATQLTAVGDVIGTARYMAPELLLGEPASVASDLFACGRVIADVVRSLGADSALAALGEELTAHEPSARPRSARAALRMLEQSPVEPPPAPGAISTRGRRAATQGRRAEPATAPTATGATLPRPARAPVASRRGARARTDRLPGRGSAASRVHISRASLLALLALLALAAAVLAIAAGEGGAPARARVPSPAARSAPLKAQLQALRREVRAASAR